MAGIMDKIGGALHIGGNKTEEKQHAQTTGHKTDEHVKYGEPAKKEGFMEKIKDKVHGGGGGEHKAGEGEKKKKKKNKEKKEGHHGGDSSSSDSD